MQVNRYAFVLSLVSIFGGPPALAASHKALPEPIYKVDSVYIGVNQGKLEVTANGAVQSGGWTNPYLRPKPSKDAHVMAFEFVAVPPPPDAVVIQALVPIEAKVTGLHPPLRIEEIRVDTETNTASALIPDMSSDRPSERLPVVHGQ